MGPQETPAGAPRTDPGRARRGVLVAGTLAVAWMAAVVLAPVVHVATAPSADITLAGHPLRVEVAGTLVRQVWGLRGRSSLPDGRGMLFAFKTARPVTFARESLTFPVDVVFVGEDGRVKGVATLDAARPTADSPGPVRWVVEVPGGWAERSGVRAGSLLDAPR